MGLLSRILFGLLLGAAGAVATAAVVFTVKQKIDKKQLKKAMESNGVKRGLIKSINNTTNVVKLQDLDSKDTIIEVHGEDVSSNLQTGDTIYV